MCNRCANVNILGKKMKEEFAFQAVGRFFHILILREYLVLTESRIQLKPVLIGGVRIVALS